MELFSIRIQRTFQLVSTGYAKFLIEYHLLFIYGHGIDSAHEIDNRFPNL